MVKFKWDFTTYYVIALFVYLTIFTSIIWSPAMRKQNYTFLYKNSASIALGEKLITFNEQNNVFMFGQTQHYYVWASQSIYELCKKTSSYSHNFNRFKPMSHTQINEKTMSIQLNEDSSKLMTCSGFSWDEKLQELIYQNKPVRVVVNYIY